MKYQVSQETTNLVDCLALLNELEEKVTGAVLAYYGTEDSPAYKNFEEVFYQNTELLRDNISSQITEVIKDKSCNRTITEI